MALDEQDVLITSGVACGCSFCAGGGQFNASESAASPDPVAASALASYSISALLPQGSPKWGLATPGLAGTVTYSFMAGAPSYADAEDRFGFAAMNQAQQTATRNALAAWSEVANINFIEVSDNGNGGSIRLGTNDQQGVSGAYAWYPGMYATAGDIYLANDSATNLNPTAGTYGYLTLLHEIGHAIGLKHPGNYNAGGGGTAGPYLPASEDNYQYTVMSYNKHPSLGYSGLATGPALYDIAAAQYLYGANMSTRTGNDTYAFNSTSAAVSRSIWDAGGTDTIDAGAQSTDAIISLVAGTFSTIGPNGSGSRAVNNISIASNVMIENAVAGRGNDMLIGNHVNNVFTGGSGNDTIHGGVGTDTAVFSGSKLGYNWSKAGDAVTISGADGTDSLYGVEVLRFADGAVTLDQAATVYRFYNSTKGTHFYTSSEIERDTVSATLSNYAYEGAVFGASATGDSVWRFFNTTTDTHFYTISNSERDWILASIPTLRFEGEAYKASAAAQEGLDPLFRFYNAQSGTHFYTANTAEASVVGTTLPQFHAEGAAYYVDLL